GCALWLVPGAVRAQDATPAPTPPADAKDADSKIELSGSIDGYYGYNFEKPAGDNPFRAFDVKDNQFSFALGELVINKNPKPLGFHIRLGFGKTADLVSAFEPGDKEVYKHIIQAYGTYVFDKKGSTVDFGKWVTPHGAEVIETQDNWNYTRGLLFTWAIPFYHMGIRAKTPLTSKLTLNGSISNGWNNVEDNNSDKTFGLGASYTLSPKLSVASNWMGGREVVVAASPGPPVVASASRFRNLVDTIVTYNATPKWSFILNHDFAWQDKLPGASRNAMWTGLAGYAKYAINDVSAGVVRAEWFWDRDGFSTGTSQTLKEVTATYERKIAKNLITRLELRHDWSSQATFNDKGSPKKGQTTLTLGGVLLF
ncbi:MAG TPA: porin, partial [Armatimonadota bacterium]